MIIFEENGSKNKVCHAAVVLPASSAVPHHHDSGLRKPLIGLSLEINWYGVKID